MRTYSRLLISLTLATLLVGCASTLNTTVVAETVAVKSIKAAVESERAAYGPPTAPQHPFSTVQHEKNLRAFKKAISAERALNDALLAWNATAGQPMPVAVVIAVQALTGVLADLQPLVPTNPAIGPVASDLATAITQLTQGAK